MTANTPPFLTVNSVARLFSEHAGKDISERTVRNFVYESQKPPEGGRPRRYVKKPIPMPQGLANDGTPTAELARGVKAVWAPGPGQTMAQLEASLLDWWDSRPGTGSGGRATENQPRRVRCWCGCGQLVARDTMCDEAIRELRHMKALKAFHDGGDAEEMQFIKDLRTIHGPRGRRSSWKAVANALEKRRSGT